jgi:hypothetical protein
MSISRLLFFILIAGNACAQPPADTKRNSFALKEMQEDFDLLQKAIEEVHGGLYRHLTRDRVNGHFSTLRTKLNTVKSKNEFITLVSETLAGLRDGHLRLEYDSETTAELSTSKLLPLSVNLEGDKVVVAYNETTDNSTIKPGMELISVNGTGTNELVMQMMPKISGDGFIETGKKWGIEKNFAAYYWIFINQASVFKVEVRAADGGTQTVTINGVTRAERLTNRKGNPVNSIMLKNSLSPNRPNISLAIHGGNIAQVSVLGFQGGSFKEELDSVFRSISEKKVKAVVLDLRGNGGGVDEYGAHLVSQFTTQPFRYFDHIHLRSISPFFTTWKPSTYEDLKAGTRPDPAGGYLVTERLHPGVGTQAPGKYPFSGRLVVLLNGGTFSTAADVTAALHGMKRATFVGEESGGGYQGNTSGLNARVILPHSGLSVRISLYDYWNAVVAQQPGRGTLPDHSAGDRVSDILDGKDPQLDLALTIADGK